jgi:hypothetical protein
LNGPRKSRLVWDTMKRVGEERAVNRRSDDHPEVTGVGRDEFAIGCAAAFGKSAPWPL